MSFLKLVIGVALGVLLADLVRLGALALLAAAAVQSVGMTFEHPDRIMERTAPLDVSQRYHGPSGAYRAGNSRACVDGYMADRDGLGWKHDRDAGHRIACEATSN